MNIEFSTLAIISVLTTLSTECVKKYMNKSDMRYVSNIIATIMSIIITTVITIIRPIIMNNEPLSPALIYNGVVMAFFGVLCATLSFDKVKDTLIKLKG